MIWNRLELQIITLGEKKTKSEKMFAFFFFFLRELFLLLLYWASVLLSDGSVGVCVRSVLGQDAEHQTAPDVPVGTLPASHRHQCMDVYMNYCTLLWTESIC